MRRTKLSPVSLHNVSQIDDHVMRFESVSCLLRTHPAIYFAVPAFVQLHYKVPATDQARSAAARLARPTEVLSCICVLWVCLYSYIAIHRHHNRQALLWTDGRYHLQAEQQLGKDWTLMKGGKPSVPTIKAYLAEHLPPNSRVGIDPFVHSVAFVKELQEVCRTHNAQQSIVDDDAHPRRDVLSHCN